MSEAAVLHAIRPTDLLALTEAPEGERCTVCGVKLDPTNVGGFIVRAGMPVMFCDLTACIREISEAERD